MTGLHLKRVRALFAWLLVALQVGAAVAEDLTSSRPLERHPLTVAEAIGTARVFSVERGADTPGGGRDVLVSPDGRKYALVLVRGDLERNGNWVEIVAGSLESLAAAARYKTVARLFLRSKGGLHDDGSAYITHSYWNRIQWMPDSKRIALLYSRNEAPVQVFAVDTRTGRVRQLSHASRGVLNYEIDTHGTLVYTSLVPHSVRQSQKLLAGGFAVQKRTSLMDVLRGDVDGHTAQDWTSNVERFFSTPRILAPRKVIVNDQGHDMFWSIFDTQFSSDGQYALLDGTPGKIPAQWSEYTQPYFKFLMTRQDNARELKSLFILNLSDASVSPLWAAPMNRASTRATWSPDGRSILLGPTFTPVAQADSKGLAGDAYVVLDAVTRRFQQLSVPDQFGTEGFSRLHWCSNHDIEITSESGKILHFRESDGNWGTSAQSCSTQVPSTEAPSVHMEIRQGMNIPPALYATDTVTGRSSLILDLNPKLKTEVLLGHVEEFNWSDAEGRSWSGSLYYPVSFLRDTRYPLVIQTHGRAPNTEFSLYGPGGDEGLGPVGGPYAAQSLAGRGIAVLQMEDKDLSNIELTPREGEFYVAAYESAVKALTQAGIVDSARVGLMGFSRTGFHVEYALTHSSYNYAAALASDNVDGGYLQELTFEDRIGAQLNGAEPFGEGLQAWIHSSVGFNVDRVHTPLRLEVQNWGVAGVLSGWEVFDRLRRLNKPVEYYVIPDIEHGVHGVQNPRQCLASQEGAVDWFDFWLNGHEDNTRGKADQYTRWRKLRKLQQAAPGNVAPAGQ